MKSKLLLALAVVSLALSSQCGLAATTNDAGIELKELVGKVKAKLQVGHKSEKDLAEELKAFDALLAEHKGEKTEPVAQILFMKTLLYAEVFENLDKGAELAKQLKRDFPDTRSGQNADKILEMMQKRAEDKKHRTELGLADGMKFPGFNEKDVTGKPLSPDNYKGKVVLIDFWATWCGPCVGELPNVLATYEKYHGKGFEVIGISLDQDQEKLTSFLKEKKIPWQQYFDGLGWSNKLASNYVVKSIPATFLLDGEGKIIGQNLRGEALQTAVNSALTKK
jgi:thiol-disulfide isomerase/thioredoxin